MQNQGNIRCRWWSEARRQLVPAQGICPSKPPSIISARHQECTSSKDRRRRERASYSEPCFPNFNLHMNNWTCSSNAHFHSLGLGCYPKFPHFESPFKGQKFGEKSRWRYQKPKQYSQQWGSARGKRRAKAGRATATPKVRPWSLECVSVWPFVAKGTCRGQLAKDPERGDSLWLFRWVQCNYTNP